MPAIQSLNFTPPWLYIIYFIGGTSLASSMYLAKQVPIKLKAVKNPRQNRSYALTTITILEWTLVFIITYMIAYSTMLMYLILENYCKYDICADINLVLRYGTVFAVITLIGCRIICLM